MAGFNTLGGKDAKARAVFVPALTRSLRRRFNFIDSIEGEDSMGLVVVVVVVVVVASLPYRAADAASMALSRGDMPLSLPLLSFSDELSLSSSTTGSLLLLIAIAVGAEFVSQTNSNFNLDDKASFFGFL